MLSHTNFSHICLVGDLNARLDFHLDPSQEYVGPAVVGRRSSLQDDDRDNAVFLIDFLTPNNLILPQTFADLPFRKRVTYKEMTCSDHLCLTDDVREWTTLDSILLPPPLKDSFSFTGSIFQQLVVVNSRHLPLSCHFRANYLPIKPPSSVPEKNFKEMSRFFESIKNDLLAKSGNSATFDAPPRRSVIAYTDGSCPNNRVVSYDNPAGWSFALVYDLDTTLHPPPKAAWLCSWGPVKSNPQSTEGLSIGSNNTGELRAIIEFFDYLLSYSDLNGGDEVVVYTDCSFSPPRYLSPFHASSTCLPCSAILYSQ